MFPPTGLPRWLNILVRINPLSYGVDLMRRLILGLSYYPLWFDLIYLMVFSVAVTFAAVFFFNRGEY
jgi:ABC-2 type transport system permease protein